MSAPELGTGAVLIAVVTWAEVALWRTRRQLKELHGLVETLRAIERGEVP